MFGDSLDRSTNWDTRLWTNDKGEGLTAILQQVSLQFLTLSGGPQYWDVTFGPRGGVDYISLPIRVCHLRVRRIVLHTAVHPDDALWPLFRPELSSALSQRNLPLQELEVHCHAAWSVNERFHVAYTRLPNIKIIDYQGLMHIEYQGLMQYQFADNCRFGRLEMILSRDHPWCPWARKQHGSTPVFHILLPGYGPPFCSFDSEGRLHIVVKKFGTALTALKPLPQPPGPHADENTILQKDSGETNPSASASSTMNTTPDAATHVVSDGGLQGSIEASDAVGTPLEAEMLKVQQTLARLKLGGSTRK
jgi:hypothetical protein